MSQFQEHYLVTGGAGFIGSHLIRELLKEETTRVTCLDNFDPFYPRRLKLLNIADFETNANFSLVDIDLATASLSQLQDVIPEPVDVLIHLAAKAGVRPSISDPLAYEQTNILGTQKLLDFAVQKMVKKFVFASSSSVYGINERLPWKEDEMLMPISPYAMTKLAGEMAGHVYHKLYNLTFLALRFFTVYGPGQRPDLAIHRFTKAILKDEPIAMYGDGSTSRDYTYVDDTVQGILAAMDYNKSGFEIMNLGNNYTVSLKELIEGIEDVVGKKATIKQLPEQPGDVPRTFADISKAKSLLNYQPKTELKTGLKNFYDWFLRNEKILMH
jgi:UDP-glucuronate 4-epimerase